jgi:hypothetical protein
MTQREAYTKLTTLNGCEIELKKTLEIALDSIDKTDGYDSMMSDLDYDINAINLIFDRMNNIYSHLTDKTVKRE